MNKLSKKAAKNGLHHSRIDLCHKTRAQIVEMLNQTLADTFDLFSQVKQAHWNVKGHQFYQLHLLFDEMAGELNGYADELAERVTAMGGTAMGTVRLAAANSSLPEYPFEALEGLDHIAALSERYAAYCQEVRARIDKAAELEDAGTADLYTEISRTADKRLWFLEAHLQADEA